MPSNRNRDQVERTLIVLAVFSFYVAGYFLIGWNTSTARARSLGTSLDRSIPFVPEAIFLYASMYTAMIYPLFVVRSRALFRRVALAYALTISISFALFLVYPVSGVELRRAAGPLDASRFASWGISVLYALDPPFNLFPSIHLSIATLAALAAWKARPVYGAISAPWLALIAASVSLVKQHYLVDVAAGVALAVAVHVVVIRPLRLVEPSRSGYGWIGPLAYLLFNAAFFAAAYVLFRAGCGAAFSSLAAGGVAG